MLVTKALESMRSSFSVSEQFAKSAEKSRKQFEALCVTPKLFDIFPKNLISNIRLNSPIFDGPTDLQRLISASQISQKLLSNTKPEKLFNVQFELPPPQAPKETPPINVIIVNINETVPKPNESIDKNTQSTPCSKPTKRKKSEQKLDDMIAAINEVIIKAQEHNILIDKKNMPTPKNEFIKILKKLYPGIFNTTLSTIAENYLPKTEFKFKNGVKRKKCKDIKRLQELFG